MTHDLKTWPIFFAALISGAKTFDLRRNDRNFALGDILCLREFEPTAGRYTDRVLTARIAYILSSADMVGIEHGFVIMGIQPITEANSTPPTDQSLRELVASGERITALVIEQTPATQTVEDIRGEKHVLTGVSRDWRAGVDDVGILFVGTDGKKKFSI